MGAAARLARAFRCLFIHYYGLGILDIIDEALLVYAGGAFFLCPCPPRLWVAFPCKLLLPAQMRRGAKYLNYK
jgi:hypothetical protein